MVLTIGSVLGQINVYDIVGRKLTSQYYLDKLERYDLVYSVENEPYDTYSNWTFAIDSTVSIENFSRQYNYVLHKDSVVKTKGNSLYTLIVTKYHIENDSIYLLNDNGEKVYLTISNELYERGHLIVDSNNVEFVKFHLIDFIGGRFKSNERSLSQFEKNRLVLVLTNFGIPCFVNKVGDLMVPSDLYNEKNLRPIYLIILKSNDAVWLIENVNYRMRN
jgi:hypothetical protein